MAMQAEGQIVHWGTAEKWIAAAVGGVIAILLSILIGVLAYFGKSMNTKMDENSHTLQDVQTQQAVTSGKVDTLTTQLADVPRLVRDMAEMKVRVERLEQDSRDNRR